MWVDHSVTLSPVNLAERLAVRLRKLRAEAGLSQVQMSKRLGLSRSTLNRLEAADQNTTLRTLDQLCRALKCEPDGLFAEPVDRVSRRHRERASRGR